MNPTNILTNSLQSNGVTQDGNVYNIMSSGDMNENVQEIGERIVENMKKHIQYNEHDTPENIKAQIKKDLFTIYYSDPDERKQVKSFIKEEICRVWYNALKTRNNAILKDFVILLNKENERDINQNQNQQGGSGALNTAKELFSKQMENSTQNFMQELNAPTQNNGVIPSTLNNKNKQQFDALIEYKSEYFENAIFKEKLYTQSATVSQVYRLHNDILTKILYNYAAIDRPQLTTHLRKYMLGEEGVKILENKSNEKSIYSIFIDRLKKLGDATNKSKSPDLWSSPQANANETVTGGDGNAVLIQKHIPSTYIWNNIKGYVEKQIEIEINKKLNSKEFVNASKTAFKDVFLQANCDSLNMDPDDAENNKQMTEYLNKEYSRILTRICEHIPNKYALSILRRYISNNFENFADYLNAKVFKYEVSPFEKYFFSNKNVPSNLFDDENILPKIPKIKLQKNNLSMTATNKSGTQCENTKETNMRDNAADTNNVSEFIKANNLENQTQSPFFTGILTPSILLPVFKIYKEQYEQLSKDSNFLASLFAIYSNKIIKLMQQIQIQFGPIPERGHNEVLAQQSVGIERFSGEATSVSAKRTQEEFRSENEKKTEILQNDDIDNYIERFILTKHSYTTKIISDCIRHVVDIKPDVIKHANNHPELTKYVSTDLLLSKYAAFLMYTASDLEPIAYDLSQPNDAKHIKYVIDRINNFEHFKTKPQPLDESTSQNDSPLLSTIMHEIIIKTYYSETEKDITSTVKRLSNNYDNELKYILGRNNLWYSRNPTRGTGTK